MTDDAVDVAIVGAGPAGLAAAVVLRRAGASVTVLEREREAGGIPRHSDHTGYGLREFRRLLRGPEYARRWVDRALARGVDLRTETTATGWTDDGAPARTLTLTSPTGVRSIAARAVVLATGTRERPRSARLVPGSRPAGVLTTGALQQMVQAGLPVGRRAVIVGAEHVSFSAVLTLVHAGCAPVAMITPEARHQSFTALRVLTAGRHRVPVLTNTSVVAIHGRERVASVELRDDASGVVRSVECDTVVFTGDWVPDHELARRGDLDIDEGTRAPRVDHGLRTTTPGVFAAGNLLHGAETAARCVESGAWVARSVLTWLHDDTAPWPPAAGVPILCEAPLRWVSPNLVVPGRTDVPFGRLVARSTRFARRPELVVRQGGRELWRGRIRSTVPTRPVHLPAGWLRHVEAGEPVRVGVTG